MTLLVVLLLLAALLVWLLAPARHRPHADPAEAPDTEELEAAEREVRDLDVHTRPENGFEADDWGPGTPKQ